MSSEELKEEIVEEPKAKKSPGGAKSAKGITKEGIIDAIKNMTVMDLADLVKTLESEFGVSAASMAVAAPAAAAWNLG